MHNQKTYIAGSIAVMFLLIVLAIRTGDTNTNGPPVADLRAPGVLTDRPNTPTTFEQQDLDGDNLMDWEENLWGTNPENPDTDGDGTSDGQEVAENRDPTRPGPNDSLAQAESNEDSENPTKTEQFAEAFFSTYIDAKARGGELSGNTLNLLVEAGAASYSEAQQYSSTDIRTTGDTSEQAVHSYGNTVGAVLLRNAPGVDNELVILLEATESNNSERLNDLLKNAEAYEANARELLAVSVPTNAAQNHLALVNGFLAVAHDVRAMAELYEDSFVAMQGLQSYFQTSEELISALETLQAYLRTRTSFTQNEAGWQVLNNL